MLQSPTPAAGGRPAATRPARLARFRREQIIVDDLDRGVSVAEIAARIGIGEKRTRAVIRETLARRMPHPPDEFVAIQVSRLDEALLIAFGAMSPGNLKAVDQVVTIVRELDRYGGAFAAEWARTPPRVNLAAGRRDRPENLAQQLEKIDSAPETPAATMASADAGPAIANVAAQETGGRDATDGVVRPPAGHGFPATGSSADGRPENPPQGLEKIKSAPGTARAAMAGADAGPSANVAARWSGFSGEAQCVAAQPEGPGLAASAPADARPKNPAQRLEKVESAPGNPFSPPRRKEGWGDELGRLAAPPQPLRRKLPQGAVSPGAARKVASRRLTLARKIRRKALKTLNPSPEKPPSPAQAERVGAKGLGDWPLSKFIGPPPQSPAQTPRSGTPPDRPSARGGCRRPSPRAVRAP